MDLMDLNRRGSGQGFTLAELLVVIGVIGLLIGITLPALAMVRASSRATACAAGLREVGRGLVLRAGDHEGYTQLVGTIELPGGDPMRIVDAAAAFGDPARRRYRYINLGLLSDGPADARLVPPDADLADFVGDFGGYSRGERDPLGEGSPWRCPEADLRYRQYHAYYRQGGGIYVTLVDPRPVDFAFNEGFFGLAQDRRDPRRLRGQLSAAGDSSRLAWLGDAAVGPIAGGTHTWAPRYGPGFPTGRVSLAATLATDDEARVYNSPPPEGRHRGGGGSANVLFADGHVEALEPTVEGLGRAILSSE